MQVSSFNSNNVRMASPLVLGAGVTGLSCVRYLTEKKLKVSLFSDEVSKSDLGLIKNISSTVEVFDESSELDEVLEGVDSLVVSPGVPLDHPVVQAAAARSLEIVGDVELFARNNDKPVIAVTGSNGKSTVVTLVFEMLKAGSKKAVLAGNIGTPVLDAMNEQNNDLYVLELSSFQLDTTQSLQAAVACILNVTPDHLDRYENFQAYADSKQNIYRNAKVAVFNLSDALTNPYVDCEEVIGFGLGKPDANNFGVLQVDGEKFLAQGQKILLPVDEMPLNRSVDIENALAASAIAVSVGLPDSAIVETLKTFTGLEHRCEYIGTLKGARWFNDSKATNVGSTLAALISFKDEAVILIAGGDSKDADVSELESEIKNCVKQLIVFGKDAEKFVSAFSDVCDVKAVNDLRAAFTQASETVEPGDLVLLSPACSSLDMFSSYQERGNEFKKMVHGVCDA